MQDLEYMKEAIEQAKIAFSKDEVPVGAIIVKDNEIIAKGHNSNQVDNNALSHAEINVINQACNHLNSKYLDDCILYVTLEPCLMCSGAILNARIKKVYFSTFDLDNGGLISTMQVSKVEWYAGLMQEESVKLLKDYFDLKRKGHY